MKFFKLIFLKPSSWPKTMYAEHWRKRAWAPPWEIFLYFQYNNSVEHLWTVAYLNMLLCFQSKMSFNRLFWLFILIYFRHFTFWNEIAFSQPLHQFSVSHGATSTGYPSREVCTNLQFSLVKLWNIIWTYGGFNLQITTSKSTHIVFILLEIAWVEIFF